MAANEPRDFAQLPPYSGEYAAACIERFDAAQEHLRESRMLNRMQTSWNLYYSRGRGGSVDDTDINTAGEEGEVVLVKPNRYQRLISDALSTVRQTPPDYQPEVINTDPEAQAQARLSLGLLDEAKRTHRLEDFRADVAEIAAVLSAGYAHVRWDATLGKDSLAGPDGGVVKEGRHIFTKRTPFEVAFDRQAGNQRDSRWWVVKEPANRFDLLARFGGDSEEIRRAILAAPKWSDAVKDLGFDANEDPNDDSIAVFFVYVCRSPACETGRESLVLDSGHVLIDGPLSEETPGVFPLVQQRVMMRGDTFTSHWNGIPLVKAHQAQFSTIATNHDNFAMQRILTARKGNLNLSRIGQGVSAVEYDHFDNATGSPVPPPKALDLLSTPQEVFTFLDVLTAEIDVIMGGSPVTRGDPNATKGDSGSKTAMLFAAAQNVSSGFVRQVLGFDEDLATWYIGSMRRHATVPRITSICGRNQTWTSKRFVGDDLAKVTRINVRQANPARDTFQGRMALAELLSGKPETEQARLLSIINTGRTEEATEDLETTRLLVERENEMLRDAKAPPPPVLGHDKHMQWHLPCHLAALDDPAVRLDPALRARFEKHIAEHIGSLIPDHPSFAGMPVLAVTGERPLPPLSAPPPMGGIPPEGDKPSAAGGKPPKVNAGAQLPEMPQLPKGADTGDEPAMPEPRVSAPNLA